MMSTLIGPEELEVTDVLYLWRVKYATSSLF